MTQFRNPADAIKYYRKITYYTYYAPLSETIKSRKASLTNFYQTERVRRRYRRRSLLLGLISDFSITDAYLEAPLMIDDIPIGKIGDTVYYAVTYKNNRKSPKGVFITQKIGDVEDTARVEFLGEVSYTRKTPYTLREAPVRLDASAKIYTLAKTYDEISQTFNVGALDDSFKPVSEYPEPNASNAVLDLSYNFEEGNNYLYPPEATGLFDYTSPAISFSNVVSYQGLNYLRPDVTSKVRLSFRLRNRSGSTVKLSSPGTLLTVIYADNAHVSQILTGSTGEVTLKNNAYHDFSDTVNIPYSFYGMLQVCKVFDVYKSNRYYTTIGVVYDFRVGRLLLP